MIAGPRYVNRGTTVTFNCVSDAPAPGTPSMSIPGAATVEWRFNGQLVSVQVSADMGLSTDHVDCRWSRDYPHLHPRRSRVADTAQIIVSGSRTRSRCKLHLSFHMPELCIIFSC